MRHLDLTQSYYNVLKHISKNINKSILIFLKNKYKILKKKIKKSDKKIIRNYIFLKKQYNSEKQSYKIRNKNIIIK
jgi:hypothetical protein